MSRKRLPENMALPPYARRTSSGFYLEPKGELLARLGGRKSFPLGKTYFEMYRKYHEIVGDVESSLTNSGTTVGQLIDKYLLEFTAVKSQETQRRELGRAIMLKKTFGHMAPEQVEKKHIYQYMNLRTKKGAMKGVVREVKLLQSVYSEAEAWYGIEHNPCNGVKYGKGRQVTPRDRYVTNDEYTVFRKFSHDRNSMIAAYMDFKYVTGLRAGDIREIKQTQFIEEGIHVHIGKPGLERIIAWSPALREATRNLIVACIRERVDRHGITRKVNSDYLLFNEKGLPYTASGWRAIFYRLMREALKQGVLKESFCEHDIRAKAGSDYESLEEASKFLAHLNVATTAKHYRRKPEVIQPRF